MNPAALIRDVNQVRNCLMLADTGATIAKKECKIYIPTRFAERNLAEVGKDTYIIGIYAIVVEDQFYAVSLVNAMVPIEPTLINVVKVDSVPYYEFVFKPGATVIKTDTVVQKDVLIYDIYNEILSKSNIPWYLSYNDLGSIFDTAKSLAGANVGENPEVTELLISIIARDKIDKNIYYRSTLESLDDLKTKQPAYISLKDVTYAASNTTNKLAGSYFSKAVVSALVNKSSRRERIESLLLR